MAVISKGITLSYGDEGSYTALTNLQEIPDLGGETEKLDITTLGDSAFMYTDGIKSYGDSLSFVFLYEKEQFIQLNALEGSTGWQVKLPDGETCSFTGSASVVLAGAGVNSVLTYTLNITPDSEMIWA